MSTNLCNAPPLSISLSHLKDPTWLGLKLSPCNCWLKIPETPRLRLTSNTCIALVRCWKTRVCWHAAQAVFYASLLRWHCKCAPCTKVLTVQTLVLAYPVLCENLQTVFFILQIYPISSMIIRYVAWKNYRYKWSRIKIKKLKYFFSYLHLKVLRSIFVKK